jgi:hypothetical protein
MANIQGSHSNNESRDSQSVVAELCRMVWLVFGPVGVFFTGVTIWRRPPWSYSIFDGIFGGLVLLTVVAKLIHVKHFHGLTVENTPSKMSDWWSYSAKLVVFAVVVWLLAQSYQV